MNEFGIDSLELSRYTMINQTMINQIDYLILKSGISSAGVPQMFTPQYFTQTMDTFANFEPSVRLMRQNGKPTGAYFFSYAWDRSSAEYEATIMCDSIDALTDKPDWPLFIDWESTGDSSTIAKMGAYEALQYHGVTPTSQIVQDVVDGWMSVVQSRGYKAGLYTGGYIGSALAGSSFIQSRRSSGLYYWEASWPPATRPYVTCDIWQYNGDQYWNGIVVDYDRIMDDRIWHDSPIPPTPSSIPIWLKMKMAKGSGKSGNTILL